MAATRRKVNVQMREISHDSQIMKRRAAEGKDLEMAEGRSDRVNVTSTMPIFCRCDELRFHVYSLYQNMPNRWTSEPVVHGVMKL